MTDLMPSVQTSSLPPAQPNYILRGHNAQVHAAHFLRENTRLITGDADGWVIFWSIPIKRSVAVWRAHAKTILGLGDWNNDKIITHGRDNKLYVWQLREEDEHTLSTVLPVTGPDNDERKSPWLLYSLDISTINFCSSASIAGFHENAEEILLATPGVQDGHINITALPSTERVATIPTPRDVKTGMLMAVGLHYQAVSYDQRQASTDVGELPPLHDTSNRLLLVFGGYESGHVCIWRQHGQISGPKDTGSAASDTTLAKSTRKPFGFSLAYISKPHTQPVLSLDPSPQHGCFFTSSADAIIARHVFPTASPTFSKSVNLADPLSTPETIQTRHAGQQSLRVRRSDGRIFATAGWDGRVRVYSSRTMKELAVLKWHREGCYALAFADVASAKADSDTEEGPDNFSETNAGQAEDLTAELSVAEQRVVKAKTTHWLAAGSKDGKVSLWEIY